MTAVNGCASELAKSTNGSSTAAIPGTTEDQSTSAGNRVPLLFSVAYGAGAGLAGRSRAGRTPGPSCHAAGRDGSYTRSSRSHPWWSCRRCFLRCLAIRRCQSLIGTHDASVVRRAGLLEPRQREARLPVVGVDLDLVADLHGLFGKHAAALVLHDGARRADLGLGLHSIGLGQTRFRVVAKHAVDVAHDVGRECNRGG